ncbi:MAG: ISL3 family transposase [bacterium]
MYNSNNVLFQLALGLQDPWEVSKIEFSKEEGRLNICLTHKKGAKFKCAECGQLLGIHDTVERTWRHLNFFQYETYLYANFPRIQCDKCKSTRNVDAPWARPGSGFTLLFEAFAMELAQVMPMSAVQGIMGENDTRLMRIITHYVEKARDAVDMEKVRKIGTDETSKAKGHNYISVFTDLEERKVLFATEGKDSSTVERFKKDLEKHNGNAENINQSCCDLSRAFVKGLSEQFPNVELVFDRFHVMSKVNKALDEVRRQEQSDNPILKKSRFAFLHNPETTTDKQKEKLESLKTLNLKTARAYQIRLSLRDIFELKDPNQAEFALKKWYFWATHSRLDPIIYAAKTIKKHWQGIVNFFKDRITNGLAEGINSIIQTIKRRARGYRNTDNFITIVYLVLGKLDFNLPAVTGLATHYK